MFESRRDEERITSRRRPAKRIASIVARTLSARTEVTPSPRVPIAERTTSLPGSSAARAFACIGLPTTIRSDFDLTPKAERPNAVISDPRAKPWVISALPVLPVAPRTNSLDSFHLGLWPTPPAARYSAFAPMIPCHDKLVLLFRILVQGCRPSRCHTNSGLCKFIFLVS
jgi:hypothetical protein